MDEQMEMVLKEGGIRDDGLNVDPVSGNEIPSGSLAEEVRDDIPAQLSGGEYVVPADVVRFFGVKYFEDLRMEAKSGLQDMERNGRIGGEPVEPQQQMAQNTNQGITEADLQALEAMMTTGAYEGGLMDKIAYTVKNDPVVNERVNKKGTSVGFAEGGQVSSMFGDPNQIDSIIDQVSIMAQQNPAIAKELNQRGIAVGQMPKQANTQQMQPRNTPAQVTNPVSQQMAVGGTPDPFARFRVPGLSSSSGMGMPQAVTPDITATPTPVVSDPVTAPSVATPDVGQCGEGRMWNGFQCVPARRTSDDNGSGGGSGGGGGGGSGKSWFEEEDILNIDSFVDDQLSGMKPESGRADKSFVGNLIGGMPAVQIATGISKLTNISKARAAVELNQKAGLITEAEADALDAKINAAASSAGILDAANKFAPGSMRRSAGERRADKFGNKDGETSQEELKAWMESVGVSTGDETVVEPESTGTGGTEGPVAPAGTTSVASPSTSADNDRTTDAEIQSMQDARARDRAQADEKERADKASRGGGYTGTSSKARETSQRTKSDLEENYGPGLNKGGLMKKKKKK